MGLCNALIVAVVIVAVGCPSPAFGWKASCHDPYYPRCYGIPHKCPPGCPRMCQIDCGACKPVCECDKPGSVCQDPRFIGGDGVMFYFHGKKDKDFTLVSDPNLQINAHFIGKARSTRARDFTWVQSIAVLFGESLSRNLYIGAHKVAKWDPSNDHMAVQLDGRDALPGPGRGSTWQYGGLKITRAEAVNAVQVETNGFVITARVVPITAEESRVHGYGIDGSDCFVHLELGFKFYDVSPRLTGVLGQTYAPGFRNPVKIGARMPILGGEDRFAVSHLFATDCKACIAKGEAKPLAAMKESPVVTCGSDGGRGVVCRR